MWGLIEYYSICHLFFSDLREDKGSGESHLVEGPSTVLWLNCEAFAEVLEAGSPSTKLRTGSVIDFVIDEDDFVGGALDEGFGYLSAFEEVALEDDSLVWRLVAQMRNCVPRWLLTR